MWHLHQVLRYPPEIRLRDHPSWISPIKACEVHRARDGAQRPFTSAVDVALEVAHGQLPHASIDGLAIAHAREIALADRSPVIASPEDGDDVVAVLDGFEIEKEGWVAQHPERGCGKNSPLEAMRSALTQHSTRRPCGAGDMIRHRVERTLDTPRAAQRTQGASLAHCKSWGGCPCLQWVTGGSAWAGGGSGGWPANRSRNRIHGVSRDQSGLST